MPDLSCTGSGQCENAVPEVFALGGDGLVQAVLDAAEVRPGRCIVCTGA